MDTARQMQATAAAITAPQAAPAAPPAYGTAPPAYGEAPAASSLYPSLNEYMGLDMSPQTIEKNMPVVVANPPQVRKESFISRNPLP